MDVIDFASRPVAWYGCMTVSLSSSFRFLYISLRIAKNFSEVCRVWEDRG
jgi:hypothetical protein